MVVRGRHRYRAYSAGVIALVMAGCASGAPKYVKPEPPAPPDWTTWRSGDTSLHEPLETSETLPENWWAAFTDPVLNELQRLAVQASPDLKTAALHFAQARVQRQTVSPQHGLQGNLNASATGRRESELGAGVRLIDALGADPAKIAPLIAEPYGFYQVGFDASWELDLWGRIRSTIEQANADIARQGALLDLARVSLAADIARSFFDVRTTQRQIRVTREEIAATQDRLSIVEAQAEGGLVDGISVERQRSDLSALKAQLPPLLAREASSGNEIALLLGDH